MSYSPGVPSPFDLYARQGHRTAFPIDPVDRGSKIHRLVGKLEVLQRAAEIVRRNREQQARRLVGADQDAGSVDDDLRVRGAFGGQLTHTELAGDVIRGFLAARLRKENE